MKLGNNFYKLVSINLVTFSVSPFSKFLLKLIRLIFKIENQDLSGFVG